MDARPDRRMITALLGSLSLCLTLTAHAAEEPPVKNGLPPITERKLREESMPNLLVPTNLEPLQVEFLVQHRFEGSLAKADDPLKKALGLEEGATVHLGLRFIPWSKLEINAQHNFDAHEYEAGLSYAVFIPKAFLKMQINAQYLNFRWVHQATEWITYSTRRIVNSAFLQYSLSTYPILGRLTPVINVGYDVFNKKRVGLGVGLSLKIVDWLYAQGEFFPNIYRDKWRMHESGGNHCYTFGLMAQTATHNFSIVFGNSAQLGMRHLMMGSEASAVHMGFNITKVFN